MTQSPYNDSYAPTAKDQTIPDELNQTLSPGQNGKEKQNSEMLTHNNLTVLIEQLKEREEILEQEVAKRDHLLEIHF